MQSLCLIYFKSEILIPHIYFKNSDFASSFEKKKNYLKKKKKRNKN